MTRTLLAWTALALFALPAAADDKTADAKKPDQGPPADSLLADGLARAKKDNKRVFLQFGSPTCGWCKVLDKYHADADVETVVDKYLVRVKVDVVTNPGGEAMYKKY